MTPVKSAKDKTGEVLAGTIGVEAPRELDNDPEAGATVEERKGRRTGIALIVAGCVLMALAAGEAAADTSPPDRQEVPIQASAGFAP